MRRTFVRVSLCLLLGLSLSAALSAEGLEVVNAVQLDSSGNINPAYGLKVDDEPLFLGDSLVGGKLLMNDGPWPVVLLLSDGRQISLETGEKRSIDQIIDAAAAEQECRCTCGSENMTLPAGSANKCEGHNGERCEDSNGKFHKLKGCRLTWTNA